MAAAKRLCGLSLALLLMGSVSCEQNKKHSPPNIIKVGALFPLTGDLKDKGIDSANGVKLAAEEINRSGGIASMDGSKLEIVFADTQGQPEIGVKEAKRLINQEGVVAIIGTYQSSVTKPASRVAEKLETPFIVSISIADIITERGFRYTFRIQPKASFYARDQVRFLKDLQKLAHYPVQRVALLHENTDFGTSAALAQKQALQQNGIKVVAEVAYRASGVIDLTPEVEEILKAEPDVVLTVTYLLDSLLIRKALADAQPGVPMLDTAGGTVSREYVQRLGPLAEGTLTVAEYSKFASGGKALNERFQKRFQKDITGDSAHAYQALLVLKDALERCCSTDKKAIRDALATTDIPKGPKLVLPSKRLSFDSSGQNRFAQLYVVQIQNGELLPVWPEESAIAAVRIAK